MPVKVTEGDEQSKLALDRHTLPCHRWSTFGEQPPGRFSMALKYSGDTSPEPTYRFERFR
jgi:hypothetical protein